MLTTVNKFPNTQPTLFAGVVAAVLLGSAFTFQFFGYPPCELCWWQRYPYIAIVLVVLGATIAKSLPQKWVLLLLSALFLADAAIAAFHVGVEQHWWEGLPGCSSYVDYSNNINDTLAALMEAPLVKCDEIAWSLFGISMAGYNMLIAAGMTAFCFKKFKNT